MNKLRIENLLTVIIMLLPAFAVSAQSIGTTDKSYTGEGKLQFLWGENSFHNRVEYKVFLQTDDGQNLDLNLESLSSRVNLSALSGKTVAVRGSLLGDKSVSLTDISAADNVGEFGEVPAAVIGSAPWLNILCRFSDSVEVTPRPALYFHNLFSTNSPALNHYWQEVSYGSINLDGSVVSGWHNLPNPRGFYIYDSDGDGRADVNFNRIINDCSAAADSTVYFPQFYGINFVFNEELDGLAYGGKRSLTRDGVTKSYGVTFLPPWAYTNQGSIVHEMGHGFGLPHSGSVRSCPPLPVCYDSQWDPMSSSSRNLIHPLFGAVVNHTTAYHKDLLGWIPETKKRIVGFGKTEWVTLDFLSASPVTNGSGKSLIIIPIRGVSNGVFYTVEARSMSGYDQLSPGEAVVIHKVDPNDYDSPARVVSEDANGDPNGAGAQWTVGETFADPSTKISITVEARTESGFQVKIVNPARSLNTDFDGDKKSDVSVFRPSTGVWYYISSNSNTAHAASFGMVSDKPVPADYDGDGLTDLAIYRPSSGIWYIWQSSRNSLRVEFFGLADDNPVPADYDRDGKADIAVHRSSSNFWYISMSSNSAIKILQFGIAGDIPIPADYDGDGKADIAVFRPQSGTWYYAKTNTLFIYPLQVVACKFGLEGDIPVPADYDGDGFTDFAVYRPQTGVWYVYNSSTSAANSVRWGLNGDKPVAGDYEGDGKADIAVFRSGIWYLLKSAEGISVVQFGLSDDMTF